MTEIPVVDIADWTQGTADKRCIAHAFGDALERVGFVAIAEHGVSPLLVRQTYDKVKAFFALALEEKLRSAPPEPAKTLRLPCHRRGERCGNA